MDIIETNKLLHKYLPRESLSTRGVLSEGASKKPRRVTTHYTTAIIFYGVRLRREGKTYREIVELVGREFGVVVDRSRMCFLINKQLSRKKQYDKR